MRVWKEGDYWLVVSEEPIGAGQRQPELKGSGRSRKLVLTEAGKKQEIPAKLYKKSFDFSTDLTGVFEVKGLKAATAYYYAAFADPESSGERAQTWELGYQQELKFRTQAKKPDKVTFGLYSCHNPYDKHGNLTNMEMWNWFGEILQDRNADFVIGGGDQVYSDGRETLSIWEWLRQNKGELLRKKEAERLQIMLSWYRDIYRGYWGPLALRQVLRSFPTYMIWDDHEIMDGWGSYTDEELSDKLDTIWEWEDQKTNLGLAKLMFKAAAQVYGEYQHSHNPATEDGRWDYHYQWGPCAFYAFDMRGTRDFKRKEFRIMGREQFQRVKSWLEGEQVKQSEVIFLISPVPMVHAGSFFVNTLDLNLLGLADDMRDEWEHESNWRERDQLLDAIFKVSHEQKKPVVFLSGDVHVAAAFSLSQRKYPEARVYQLTSSAISYNTGLIGRGLKLVVHEEGKLVSHPRKEEEHEEVYFQALHAAFEKNNFGVATVEDGRVRWDLYGSSGEEDRIVRLKRVIIGKEE
ncbi:MAG TPA: alkaline phosphatase D family protein [Acidobacteriota bacterium]|nr:alkaline phosphatase D family protein [Acidobacteriota bacterium]